MAMGATAGLEEVKRRIVALAAESGSDARGGIDMAKLAPGYKRKFGAALDASAYGYAKLSLLVTAMDEVVVDYCGPGTRSVVRLAGERFTPRPQKATTPKKAKSELKAKKQQARAAGGGEGLASLDEVRTRIVSLVQNGNEGREGDSYGGVDMARVAPLWTKAYGSKLVPAEYGYAKLGPMIADMSDILVVDHIHKTKKVVRLAGAPGVNAAPPPMQLKAKPAKRGAPQAGPNQAAAAAVEPTHAPQDDGWGEPLQPAALGGWDDPTAGVDDWGSSEAEPSVGWDDPPASAPASFGMGMPAAAPVSTAAKKVFAVSPRFDSMQQAALGAPLQVSASVGATAQLFGLAQPGAMNASVQSFFGQAAAGFGAQQDDGGHVAATHSTPAPVVQAAPAQPASPPADQLLFGAPLPDEGWGGPEAANPADENKPDGRRDAPVVDPVVAAERAAAKKAKDEKKRAAQKAKREEAKLKKRAAAEARKAAEAEARKQKKDLEQAGKRGKALCSKLRGALSALDPRLMLIALADADRFVAQFAEADLPAVAQEVEEIGKLRVNVKAAYTTQALEAIEEMTTLLDSDADLGAVSSAVNRYASFSEDSTVEAIRGVLLTKVDAAKTELRDAVAAAEGRPAAFAELNSTIEKYAGHARILQAEIREAKAAKSALLSQCARELGGLVHKSTKRGSSVTAGQMEEKMALFADFPEEGSIGESMSKIRPLLAKKRREEEAKAKAIAVQKAKDAALKAKKERAEQQAKEDAEFWAQHEAATLHEAARQEQLWAEAAAAAEAVAAAKEAEKKEAERIAAAQAEHSAAKTAKELTPEQKAERKAAKKARQAEERAKAQEEKQKKQTAQAEEAAAQFVEQMPSKRIPSVLKTSPHFSPLREGDEAPGGQDKGDKKKVGWLDLDAEAAEDRERKKAEKKREANRKKKQKKKQKEAEKKAAAAAAGTAAVEGVASTAAAVSEGDGNDVGEDDLPDDDDAVDFATDSYKEHYDAMEELD